jgi:predicted outer membrane repeat protein
VSATDLKLNNDTFTNNTAATSGGAIYLLSTSRLTMVGGNFRGNWAKESVGGAISTSGWRSYIASVAFTQNHAGTNGGAIAAIGGLANNPVLIVSESTFTSNSIDVPQGGFGGAIYSSMDVDIDTSGFTANRADFGGAVLWNDVNINPKFSLADSTLRQNVGRTYGGAVSLTENMNSGTATVSITGVLFDSNKVVGNGAQSQGGALRLDLRTSGTATITTNILNSTFYNSSADGSGGAIYAYLDKQDQSTNQATLTSLTVWKNSAVVQGGGVWFRFDADKNVPAPPVVRNSIIAGNTLPANGVGVDFYGTVNNGPNGGGGYDLIGIVDNNSNGWGPNDTLKGTAANPLDPGLDPNGPTNNGPPGGTWTIKLLPGSAAYRAGDPSLLNDPIQANRLDQRGYTRTMFVSIGAYDPDAVPPM